MDAGIAEADRRARGDFDGLLGSLPAGSSDLLRDLLDEMRWVLLEHYDEPTARGLLAEYAPTEGYRNLTPIPDDVELALRSINLIAAATRCTGDRRVRLVFGPSELRRREGARRGGASRAAPEWWTAAKTEARRLLASGASPRNLVGKLAPKFPEVGPASIRRALQEAGLLPKKK